MFSDVKFKNLTKVEHFLWCNPIGKDLVYHCEDLGVQFFIFATYVHL
jgi:hypothetical protein